MATSVSDSFFGTFEFKMSDWTRSCSKPPGPVRNEGFILSALFIDRVVGEQATDILHR